MDAGLYANDATEIEIHRKVMDRSSESNDKDHELTCCLNFKATPALQSK